MGSILRLLVEAVVIASFKLATDARAMVAFPLGLWGRSTLTVLGR